MKLIFLTVLIITLDCAYSDVKPPIINGQFVSISNASWNTQHIHGYHFHTYFFQSSNHSKQQAIEFR